jgi:phosphoglycolate phosphatase
MKNPFKLLVFDWDGTLMDSEARIVDCVRAAVTDLGLDMPENDRIRNIIGLGLSEAVSTLFPGVDETLNRGIGERYRHHFLVENKTPSRLFEGVRETLVDLDADGYLLAVATGKGRRGLDQALEHTGLGAMFRATRCSDETFSKPHPEMLLQLMVELGVEREDTLMIGDTEYDMQMAINAGTRMLGVSYGVHSADRLSRHGPLGVADSVKQIPGLLRTTISI